MVVFGIGRRLGFVNMNSSSTDWLFKFLFVTLCFIQQTLEGLFCFFFFFPRQEIWDQ